MADFIQQTKKDPNDPNAEDIDSRIVQLGQSNGFISGPFILYLSGAVTWREALELMVIAVTKESRDVKRLAVEVLQGNPSISYHQPIALLLNEISQKDKDEEAAKKRAKKKAKKLTHGTRLTKTLAAAFDFE